MRRIAAAILLFVFGAFLPSAAMILLAAPAAMVPICCRAHGAHHCMMMALMNGAPENASGPQFRQPECPYRNILHAITSGPVTVQEHPRSSVALAATPFRPVAETEIVAPLRFSRSNPRGPPASLRSQI